MLPMGDRTKIGALGGRDGRAKSAGDTPRDGSCQYLVDGRRDLHQRNDSASGPPAQWLLPRTGLDMRGITLPRATAWLAS
jgi:hypothetical protein